MPAYFYKAKKDSLHTVNGQITAADEEEALDAIHQLGLIPVSLQESTAQGGLVSDIRTVKIKHQELYLFSKQLAGLIKSGVPLLRALEVISEQTKSVYLTKVILDVAIGVKSGRSFSSCLMDFADIFPPLFIAMVRAGEEMGRLREMLNSIADYLKKQQEFSAKVRAALVYPALMLAVGFLTVIFILTFVMPKMAVIFVGSGQRLPLPTVIVMGISRFFQHFWIPLGLVMSVAVVTFSRWRATPQGAWAIGSFLLRVPLVRDMVIKADLARFSGTMRLLLVSGLPIIRAIEVAVPTVHNPQLKLDLLNCAADLSAGENFGQSLAKSALIPSMMIQLVAVGEESGSLNESLGDVALAYEEDIDEATKMITTVLEPIMILGVGLVVGFIVFAMLLPVFSMDIMAR